MGAKIDLVETIEGSDPKNLVLFTTFKFNHLFFENNIFKHFKDKTHPIVLADYSEYQGRMGEIKTSRYAGRKYYLHYAKCKGVFHPKVFLSVSEKEVTCIIGSNNLTREGYTNNAELVVPMMINLEDPSTNYLLDDLSDFLECLSERVDSQPHQKILRDIKARITRPKGGRTGNVWLIHSMKRPIMDQILEIINEPIECIEVFAPFYSHDVNFFNKMKQVSPRVRLVIQQNKTSISTDVIRQDNKVSFSKIDVENDRYMHAKLFTLKTNTHNYFVIGSANFTSNALSTTDNVEMVVLQRTSTSLDEVLADIGDISEISPDAVKGVERTIEAPSQEIAYYIIQAEKVNNTLEVLLSLIPEGDVRVLVNGETKNWTYRKVGNSIIFDIPDDEEVLFNRSVGIQMETYGTSTVERSDSMLVHNSAFFSDEFNLLNSLKPSEANWLYRVLLKLSKMKDFGLYIRILDELDETALINGGFEKAARSLNIKKVLNTNIQLERLDQPTRLGEFINRTISRHSKRIARATANHEINAPWEVASSFILINKLILFAVTRGYLPKGTSEMEFLKDIKIQLESFFKDYSGYYDVIWSDDYRLNERPKLKYHVAILVYLIDYLQQRSPIFRPDPRFGYSPLLRVFHESNISTLRRVLNREGVRLEANILQKHIEEYLEVCSLPVIFNSTQLVFELNQLIINTNPLLINKCPSIELT